MPKEISTTDMGSKLYNIDHLIALSHQLINMYGYVRSNEIDKLARLHLEKSNANGLPLPVTHGEWAPKELDYNKAFSTMERVLDYYDTYEPKESDAELVVKIKADFKRIVLKILGGTATKFQEMTANILSKEEIEQYQVGVVCSWPYIVQKRKEKVNA